MVVNEVNEKVVSWYKLKLKVILKYSIIQKFMIATYTFNLFR